MRLVCLEHYTEPASVCAGCTKATHDLELWLDCVGEVVLAGRRNAGAVWKRGKRGGRMVWRALREIMA